MSLLLILVFLLTFFQGEEIAFAIAIALPKLERTEM
jgi:hypothetical protein